MGERAADEKTGQLAGNGEMLDYVQRIARKVRKRFGKQVSEADLVAYGVVGYLEASARFEQGRGVSLHQYVYLRTYGAMIDGVRRWSLQRHLWATHRRSELRAKRQEGDSGGGEPLCMSSFATMTTVQMDDFRKTGRGLGASREAFCAGPQGTQLEESRSIEEIVETRRRWGQFLKAAQVLARQERALLTLYYMEGYSMSEVAERLGCTKSWVCRMHQRTLEKLRHQLKESACSDHGVRGKQRGCSTPSRGMNRRGFQPSSPSPVSSSPASPSPVSSSPASSSPASSSPGPQASQEGKN
jgi:RNA polymerase sigma factor for flagellar operon FliA